MTQQVITEEESTWRIKTPKNVPEDSTKNCETTELYREIFNTLRPQKKPQYYEDPVLCKSHSAHERGK